MTKRKAITLQVYSLCQGVQCKFIENISDRYKIYHCQSYTGFFISVTRQEYFSVFTVSTRGSTIKNTTARISASHYPPANNLVIITKPHQSSTRNFTALTTQNMRVNGSQQYICIYISITAYQSTFKAIYILAFKAYIKGIRRSQLQRVQ